MHAVEPDRAAYRRRELLRARRRAAQARTASVIVDEIYAELVYDGERLRRCSSSRPDLRERIVIVDGVSKRFAMTGYRVGWMLGARALARACEAVQSQATTSVAAVSQLAAQAALEGPEEPVLAMRARVRAPPRLAGRATWRRSRFARTQAERRILLFVAVDGCTAAAR